MNALDLREHEERSPTERTCRARGRLVALICTIGLAAFACRAGGISPSTDKNARAAAPLELTDEAIASLRAIAQEHPCAVLALLRIRQSPRGSLAGPFYLSWVPSPATIERLLSSPAEERDLDVIFAFQQSIYGEQVPRALIQWRESSTREGAYSLSIHAELVDAQRAPLRPRHLLERPVDLQIDGTHVRVMPNGSDLARLSGEATSL